MDKEQMNKIWKQIKKKPNVIGFSSSLLPKIVDGKEVPGSKVLRVYVSKKVPKECLKAKQLVPENLKISSECVETDVIEIGEIKALDNKEKVRPVCAGISTMHKDGTACTVNGFFKDNDDNEILIASNNHCFYMENKAKIGDELLQPGPYDGGKLPEDIIGRFKKGVEIKFGQFACKYRNSAVKIARIIIGQPLNNLVDIAFGTLEVPIDVMCTYIGKFKGRREEVPLGEKVTKSGRTTEQTFGTVIDTDWVGSVTYGRGQATFEDCYLIEGNKFSQGGDSGSPVFDMNGNYIGALFAGSDTVTIVCKLSNIELEGNVTLVTSPE